MRSFFSIITKVVAVLCILPGVVAFAPHPANRPRAAMVPLSAAPQPISDKLTQFLTTAAVVISTSPLIALAEEVDDYEYGAVNAPIGIAWAGGVLAVLTALLPLALRGGEDAFNEMKDRDAGKWGTGSTDALNRRKK
mmetsp:Transcript_100035/g.287396  ORF Transcript_100035/g.287396 Transcript_100035/m.287396 type:complete len:137 (+) Transcript_100035:124-534(+)